MGKVDFDRFAEDYDEILGKQLRFFESGPDYFAHYKAAIVKNLLRHDPVKILEFGCGIGNNIKHLTSLFPNAAITGCDISKKCLDIATTRNPAAAFFHFDADSLPAESLFDLIFIANVFHHILPDKRNTTMRILKRLIAPKGELFVFEHNPYNPITLHLVTTCPFDGDAQLLKPKEMTSLLTNEGFSIIRKHFILFFPSALSFFRPIERYLAFLPLGGQYVIQAHIDEG